MSTYKVTVAFYVETKSEDQAALQVEDEISAQLAANYDLVDTEAV